MQVNEPDAQADTFASSTDALSRTVSRRTLLVSGTRRKTAAADNVHKTRRSNHICTYTCHAYCAIKQKCATATVAVATQTDPDEMLVDPLGKRLLLNGVPLVCNTGTQAFSLTNTHTHTHTHTAGSYEADHVAASRGQWLRSEEVLTAQSSVLY